MSNIYRQTIRGLEQEQEAIMQRHGELGKAIDILEPLAGPEDDEDEDEPPAAAPRVEKAAKEKTSKAKPADDDRHSAAILAALKKAGGCLRPGELSAAIKLDGYAFRAAVIALDDAGQVKRKGNGRGAVVMLPGYKPAKEER